MASVSVNADMGFRDRFYTPTTAKAILSWRILLGVAAGVVAGLIGRSVLLAVGVAIVVYVASVLLSLPRQHVEAPIDPFTLSEPWRQLMQGAQQSRRKFRETIATVSAGPLRESLDAIGAQLEQGLGETWRVAKAGDDIDDAVRRLDPPGLRSKLTVAEARAAADHTPENEAAVASIKSQIESADRLKQQSEQTVATLRMTQTQLDGLVARAAEVSVGAADTTDYAKDVDDLVIQLEALRQAVEDTRTA